VPLAVLELHFRAERARRAWVKTAMGVALGLLALATLAGSTAAAAFMWWSVLWAPSRATGPRRSICRCSRRYQGY